MFLFLKHRIVLAVIPFILMGGVISSCCIGSYKCKGDDLNIRFRLLSSGGNDQLFGSGRIYDIRQIKIYSLRGTDTVFHQCLPGPNPEPNKDSIMYLSLAGEPYEKVYARWSHTVTDSLSIQLTKVDASPCCPDYTDVISIRLNNATAISPGAWAVFEFKK